jgi:uncharacterized protein RhaS with RHS repeats
MKSIMICLLLSFIFFNLNPADKKTDWEKAGLKGKVKSSSEKVYAIKKNKRRELIRSHSYEFNEKGYILSNRDGDTLTDYHYDEKGSLTEEVSDSFLTRYQYDKNGIKVEEIKYGENESVIKEISYRYDNHGYLIEQITKTGSDKEVLTNQYNSNGNLVEQVIIFNHDTPGKNTYTYDDKGKMIKLKMFNGTYTDYQYDINGNLIQEITFNRDGSVVMNGNRQLKITYQYNNNGKLIKKSDYMSNDSYKYDKNGNKVEELKSLVNGYNLKYIYDYDNVSNIKMIKAFNNKGDLIEITAYQYNYY